MTTRRSLIKGIGMLLGVVPATYLVFWAVLFGVSAIVFVIAPPEDMNGVALLRAVSMLLASVAAVVGYVALLRAVNGVRTSRVAIGLMLGIAANAYGVVMMFDLNAYAMRDWSTWFWFGSPSVVASAYLVSCAVHGRHRSTRGPAL